MIGDERTYSSWFLHNYNSPTDMVFISADQAARSCWSVRPAAAECSGPISAPLANHTPSEPPSEKERHQALDFGRCDGKSPRCALGQTTRAWTRRSQEQGQSCTELSLRRPSLSFSYVVSPLFGHHTPRPSTWRESVEARVMFYFMVLVSFLLRLHSLYHHTAMAVQHIHSLVYLSIFASSTVVSHA
jgi:hypothetical protein